MRAADSRDRIQGDSGSDLLDHSSPFHVKRSPPECIVEANAYLLDMSCVVGSSRACDARLVMQIRGAPCGLYRIRAMSVVPFHVKRASAGQRIPQLD